MNAIYINYLKAISDIRGYRINRAPNFKEGYQKYRDSTIQILGKYDLITGHIKDSITFSEFDKLLNLRFQNLDFLVLFHEANPEVNLMITPYIESNRRLQECFQQKYSQYECVSRMKHNDGHWVWILNRGKVFSWTKDELPELMHGSHIDISAIKELEEKLNVEWNKLYSIFNSCNIYLRKVYNFLFYHC